MKRSVISAAVVAVLGSVSVASAENSKPDYAFTANAAALAPLSANAAAEVRHLLGDVDLSGLNSADVGAIEAVLASGDAARGAEIRAILIDAPVVEAARADTGRLFVAGTER